MLRYLKLSFPVSFLQDLLPRRFTHNFSYSGLKSLFKDEQEEEAVPLEEINAADLLTHSVKHEEESPYLEDLKPSCKCQTLRRFSYNFFANM